MKGSDSLVQEAREFAEEAYLADEENRAEALIDLEFISGNQWDAADRKAREDDGRPVLTINRLIQPVKQVVNDIRQTVPSVKVVPVDQGADEGTAGVMAGILRQVQRQSRATWVYAMAAGHAAMCGIGHFRILTQYAGEDAFDQELSLKLIPHPNSVLWDPAATEPDRSDAKRCLVLEYVPEAEFQKRYPKAVAADFDAGIGTSGTRKFRWSKDNRVVIAEYWKMVPTMKTIGLLTDGSVIDMTNVAGLPPGIQVTRTREIETYRVEQTIVSGREQLSEVNAWAGKYIPIIPVLGNEIPLENKTYRHGLTRFARDPMKMYNYWRSSSAEWIGMAPKSPILATPDEIGDFKEMWDTANKVVRPYLLYKRDPQNPQAKPYREPPPSPPSALWQEGNISSDEIKATTGIYDASLGNRSNEVSGKAIMARQREGDIANFEYSDNLKISLQRAGAVMIDLIPKIYDTSRIVRILDEEEREEAVPINHEAYSADGETVLVHDLAAGKYDVTITIGASQTTRRIEAAESMIEYFKFDPEGVALARDIVAEAMDWPGKDRLAKRFKRAMPPEILGDEAEGLVEPPPPDPMVEQAKAIELDDKAAAAAEKKSKVALNLAKAKREEAQSVMQQFTGETRQ